MLSRQSTRIVLLQQSLPFTVCSEGCEIAKEQSDDEVRTSQVPERSEGKTKVIKQQPLPFTVLKLKAHAQYQFIFNIELQQPLPFTVLKLPREFNAKFNAKVESCNSAYRSRY